MSDITEVVPTRFVHDLETEVSALFMYAAEDPFAVTVRFMTVEGETDWTFARDLLLDGLTHDCGEGDIRVGPDGLDRIYLDLRSDQGTARLNCDRTMLTCFVDQMYAHVPEDQESRLLEMDPWLAQLMTDV